LGRGKDAEWLGSITNNGFPDRLPPMIMNAATEQEYRAGVRSLLELRADSHKPVDGWPWPWDDSTMTDFAYAWDGQVLGTCFGGPWMTPNDEPPDEAAYITRGKVVFPRIERKPYEPKMLVQTYI
jgi:hypothetical protein